MTSSSMDEIANGSDFPTMPGTRKAVENRIEQLIASSTSWTTIRSWIGAPERHPHPWGVDNCQLYWADGAGHPAQDEAVDCHDWEVDNSDDEPGLGAPEQRAWDSQTSWAKGSPSGREEECDFEPWLGGGHNTNDDREGDGEDWQTIGDNENSLGWTTEINQTVAMEPSTVPWSVDDGEATTGFDDREDQDEREPDDDGWSTQATKAPSSMAVSGNRIGPETSSSGTYTERARPRAGLIVVCQRGILHPKRHTVRTNDPSRGDRSGLPATSVVS